VTPVIATTVQAAAENQEYAPANLNVRHAESKALQPSIRPMNISNRQVAQKIDSQKFNFEIHNIVIQNGIN
jgi:hypothetical protein